MSCLVPSKKITNSSSFPTFLARMEKMNGMLRKCKSLSKYKLGRSSSYTTLSKSKSTREVVDPRADEALVFVGSSRRPYLIDVKYLEHPLISTLSERPYSDGYVTVKCEVVLFDHLLWMLETNQIEIDGSLEELASLYAC